jgi:D-3-phosphoglycerate dehydrogenase / 2-oxoglutarate reductase
MLKIGILEWDSIAVSAMREYSEFGTIIKLPKKILTDSSDQYDAEVLHVHLKYYIGKDTIKKIPKLRFIVSPTTGLNHIDENFCREQNITIVSLKNETDFLEKISATAELTVGIIFSAVRRIHEAVQSTAKLKWDRTCYYGRQLKSVQIGIIGNGRIGKLLTKFLQPYGPTIRICELNDYSSKVDYGKALEDLLRNSDVICLCIDYRKCNDHFVDSGLLKMMKNDGILINTSRGELINHEDLINALEVGQIGGYWGDVLPNEQADSKYWLQRFSKISNAFFTPHIGGACVDAMEEAELFTIRKLRSIVNSEIKHSIEKEA